MRQADGVACRMAPERMDASVSVGIQGPPRVVLEARERGVCLRRPRLRKRVHHVLSLCDVLGCLLRLQVQVCGKSGDVRVRGCVGEPNRSQNCFELRTVDYESR